ncbi:hypothetical protein GUJ93_ZPchr0015g6763 [Zizania palustris]|uniref:Uncharacterized protein n=1 Tax=Zizania palustris TaxID=103762 RepID=A0A8J5TLK1_ZIZPA|nr:hypothetical protein GUJ93_ZPchr0015g6763 [Zizania palustris]
MQLLLVDFRCRLLHHSTTSRRFDASLVLFSRQNIVRSAQHEACNFSLPRCAGVQSDNSLAYIADTQHAGGGGVRTEKTCCGG